MITAQALAVCIFTASQTYAVPPSLILGVLTVEGGREGLASRNTNGSYDLGPMQINTIWLPELARYWRVSEGTALRMLRDNSCVNIGVGAWILRSKMNETGDFHKGIAYYHSATPHLGEAYRQKVVRAMYRYNSVRELDDLLALANNRRRTVRQRG